MTGRPSDYSEEISDKICDEIAHSNKGLRSVCDKLGIGLSTVHQWLNRHEEFADKYARARESQADFLADEIIEIADEVRRGKKKKTVTSRIEDGDLKLETETTEEHDNTERSRLMIDARKWKAGKLRPKKYGDKLDITSKDKSITPNIDLSKLSFEQLQAIARGGEESGENRTEQA